MKIMIRAHDLGVRGEENIVKRLDEWGLDGVQLVAYKSFDGISYSEGSLTRQRALEIGSAIRRAGKEVGLVGAYFNPVHPDEKKVEHGIKIFREYLELSSALGAVAVGSESGSYMGDVWGYHPKNRTEEAFERAVGVFSSLAKRAEELGAFVAIEGAFNHVFYSPEVLSAAVRRIGGRAVKVIVDLYNYLDISNYTEAYSILKSAHGLFGDNILLYHLKDFTVEGEGLRQCAVGKGVLDYRAILGEIYAHNKNAVLVLEGTVGDDVPAAVEYLRKIIRGITRG